MTPTDSVKRSAFTSLGITILVILIAVLTSLFYYLTANKVTASNNALEVTASLTAQSVIEKVDRNFYERFGDVQAYAYNKLAVATATSDTLVDGVQSFINTMTAYYVLYDLMLICDIQGKGLAVNTKDKNFKPLSTQHFLDKNYQGEEWFEACTSASGPAGGAWYSDFLMNPEIGKVYGTEGRGMAFAAPIRDSAGAVVGVWYNFASWREVTEGIREEAEKNLQKDHPGAFIVLTSKDGQVISAADQSFMGKLINTDTAASDVRLSNNFAFPQDDYIYARAAGTGAYTYAGKHWVAITFIPRQVMSWNVFFSSQNLLAVGVSLLVVALISLYVYRTFRKNVFSKINFIRDLQERLGGGEIFEVKTEDLKPDEFGAMTRSLATLALTLKHKSTFADEISQGNLDAELRDLSSKDVLGNSLINMRNQLRSTKQTDSQRNWTAEGLAQMAMIIRSFKSIDELYHDIIKFVVTYTGANQGGLFIITEEDGEKMLGLAACYAYEKRRFLDKKEPLDKGLTGQCIMEKQTIFLKQIPANYITITSGLGGANPKSLLIVPLKTNDEVYGALEIASFKEFQLHEIALVEKLAETIGASLGSVSTGERTRTLLEQLQQQTEEMKSQEEEMRQNMEELSATQEEMLRKEKEYLQRIKTLEKTAGATSF
jgi:methyl-accepting chemotaxis protein